MLNPKTYQTPNAIDPGEAPPSRPSRRISATASVPSVQDVRLNAARLLQETETVSSSPHRHHHSPTSMSRNTFPYDADDRRDEEMPYIMNNMSSHEGASLPSVEEARLYAGRILSAKSTRDLSPVSAERARLTANANNNSMSPFQMEISRGVPLMTPSHIKERRRRTMRLCLFATLGMAVVAIIIGLSVHIAQSNASASNNASASSNTGGGTNTPAQPSGTVDQSQRLLNTHIFLRSYGVSNKDHLDATGTPQNQAAIWMADHDALQYTVPTAPAGDDYISFVQRYVLAVLYFSTGGHQWKNQNFFLDKEHECAWFTRDELTDGEVIALGVSCNTNLEVSELLMPRNGMTGNLPTELAHLTKLHFVDLNRNSLTGPAIPDTLERLTDMQFFDVRYNQLTGYIPLWLGTEWSQITELALADNAMGGLLPDSMNLLHNLKSLALANNDFDGTLAPILNLNSLEFLYLEKNRFSAVVDDQFMADMENLIQVDISSNRLTGTDIPLHLFQHPKLQVLDLSDNNIMGQLPLDIPVNTKLMYLALSDNILTGSLPPTIDQLQALHHLDMTGNDLSGPIPTALASMPKLTYLFLSENGFTEGPIPDFISSMHQLRELSLSSTSRTGTLPQQWLGGLDHLILFDVSYNKIGGSIPANIWNLPKLSYLLLNRNELTGALPDGIADASLLKMVLLDKNDVTGDMSAVCQQQNTILNTVVADCDDLVGCTCCQCCSDSEVRCNDDILYTNMDFSWEHNYTRTSYAFSPEILFESV